MSDSAIPESKFKMSPEMTSSLEEVLGEKFSLLDFYLVSDFYPHTVPALLATGKIGDGEQEETFTAVYETGEWTELPYNASYRGRNKNRMLPKVYSKETGKQVNIVYAIDETEDGTEGDILYVAPLYRKGALTEAEDSPLRHCVYEILSSIQGFSCTYCGQGVYVLDYLPVAGYPPTKGIKDAIRKDIKEALSKHKAKEKPEVLDW